MSEAEDAFRASIRARQLVADLDADRRPQALDRTVAGLRHELDVIQRHLRGALSAEMVQEFWTPPTLPEADAGSDPTLFEAQT